MILDAYWLPGLRPDDVAAWEIRELGALVLRWPVLLPEQLRAVLAVLAENRDVLRRASVTEIVAAVDATAGRFADPADPVRAAAETALPLVTGYSLPMVRLLLDRMAADWRAPALERLLRAELGDATALDGFVPDPGVPRRVRARGPELAFHVFAGNVPGVAVTSLIRSLLVKTATLGKTAAGEPVLAPHFARALADVHPGFAGALAIAYWPGGAELDAVALAAADVVVAYGGAEALAALAARAPTGARLLDHGPRYSFGVVGRAALARAEAGGTAAAVARAVAAFDQQGCVSPHAVYAERGGEVEPREFAALVAEALARLESELPRGRIGAAEAAAIHQARGAAEFRALAGSGTEVHAGPGTAYTVVFDPDPAFTPSCLNRFLWVKPLDRLLDAAGYVRPFARFLQTVAIAGAGEQLLLLAEALAAAGACRITSFEAAPWPPPEWHHDGRGPLRELLRWTDLDA